MARFFEDKYAEAHCRLCTWVTCCKECRRKHEVKVHNVNPDCYICIYGVVYISQVKENEELALHIKERHFPLHCVTCKKVFETLEGINEHDYKCAEARKLKEAAKTPLRPTKEASADYDSPETVATMSTDGIITSTPFVAKMKMEVNGITPVEANRFQIDETPMESTRKENSGKRVTFSMTPAPPAMDNMRKPRKNPDFLKSSLKNSMRLNDSQFTRSMSLVEKNSSFHSAKSSTNEIHVSTQNSKSESEEPKRKRRSQSMNETLWMSALNHSVELEDIAEITQNNNQSHHISFETSHDDCCYPVQDAGTSYDASPPQTSVWASVTTMFSKFVKSLNTTELPIDASTSTPYLKRSRSVIEGDVEERILKRYKMCDVKCRPPIRPFGKRLVPKVDKSIQTDDYAEDL